MEQNPPNNDKAHGKNSKGAMYQNQYIAPHKYLP
jgi:hypothetical protein